MLRSLIAKGTSKSPRATGHRLAELRTASLRDDAGPADRTALPGPRAPTSANTQVAAEGATGRLEGGVDAEELDADGSERLAWVVADSPTDAWGAVCVCAPGEDGAVLDPTFGAVAIVADVLGAPTAVPSLRV